MTDDDLKGRLEADLPTVDAHDIETALMRTRATAHTRQRRRRTALWLAPVAAGAKTGANHSAVRRRRWRVCAVARVRISAVSMSWASTVGKSASSRPFRSSSVISGHLPGHQLGEPATCAVQMHADGRFGASHCFGDVGDAQVLDVAQG